MAHESPNDRLAVTRSGSGLMRRFSIAWAWFLAGLLALRLVGA